MVEAAALKTVEEGAKKEEKVIEQKRITQKTIGLSGGNRKSWRGNSELEKNRSGIGSALELLNT